ncbi:NAD-dependent formate dehydrogenase [Streptomyces libani]|uniref:Formate dehydrogenase n=2 Tax=Streptomyces nigrescens TaxID=1920 RepID=A0A640TEF3_STRNI|nr:MULTISPECIES: NAD-dependent formate dehydrogenase [Streptomyces]MCW7988322.1 formate dehydrogenase [Streptomyces platensis subsp. clarensis]MCX5448190.1 NAD-dependent formate dehydrogenase [Streptomyces libani]WAT95429.1 NAD-dependent formate dehydrogenase [Streptomyces libani subsp. libani]WAU03053.1 NAD-dependent formate dehydrogenase [Streptomyces nigrescens]WDT58958.1 NAD-dependent formate dehydrogenase [Streptomyces sp. G7(2002)]
MAKILAVLYPDPVGGYPPDYARDEIPTITGYPGGQTAPTPQAIDFTPGQLLGCVSGELGLRRFLEERGHTFVVTSDKEGAGSALDRELPDSDVVISQPFWPAYLTPERIAAAPRLKLAITAGIGSDHVDLPSAISHGMTVAEVTFSNSISVSEHAVMQMLTLVHNYLPAHDWVTTQKGWNIADSVSRAYDIEGMDVGVLGSGRIGQAVLRRLKPFGVTLHYCDVHRLPKGVEEELGLIYHPDVRSLASSIDVLSIHTPLHPQTQNLFDDELIGAMKRGAYIVNTARALIVNRDAVVRALNSGQLAGYAGDVWYPQPPPPDHPWRTMPYEAMTPHVSGSTLSAQARYAAGAREILECWLDGRPVRQEYLIVDGGGLAGAGARSYTVA